MTRKKDAYFGKTYFFFKKHNKATQTWTAKKSLLKSDCCKTLFPPFTRPTTNGTSFVRPTLLKCLWLLVGRKTGRVAILL